MTQSDVIAGQEMKGSPPSFGPPTLNVALICMPFASADRPSIQMGLLKALVVEQGFDARVIQMNLDLAAQLGSEIYEQLCEQRAHMTGEWLFSYAAFGDELPHSEQDYYRLFASDFAWGKDYGLDLDTFTRLRRAVLPQYIEKCAELIPWDEYDVVGFSSMFQQNTASLALANLLKRRFPEIVIVFGGANMDGEMGLEYANAFKSIDYVVRGEADKSFPELLKQLAGKKRVISQPGIITRRGNIVLDGGSAPAFGELDNLPTPLYHDYFDRAEELTLVDSYKSTWTLPFESSRGCWWGQKHHCTFCGLNGETMGYRSKKPERVLAELTELAQTYRVCSFVAVDNILDQQYIRSLFGEIESCRLDYNFFYEIKSNLTRAQIKQLHLGGVRRVQPGIESLSTHVLKLMRKGATMLQNIRCLKWCLYYGIGVNWNLIWGFPGENEKNYEDELAVLKAISHLEPPIGSGRIWLERFSPHFDDPSFPVTDVQPEASYQFVYPERVNLGRAAYFFDYRMDNTVHPDSRQSTNDYLEIWRTSWNSPDRHSLTYRRTMDAVLIDRNHGPERQSTVCLTGLGARIFESCIETIRTPAQIARMLSDDYAGLEDEDVEQALNQMCNAGYVLCEDNRYLNLALPQNPHW